MRRRARGTQYLTRVGRGNSAQREKGARLCHQCLVLRTSTGLCNCKGRDSQHKTN